MFATCGDKVCERKPKEEGANVFAPPIKSAVPRL
jgi:hypothetical protein